MAVCRSVVAWLLVLSTACAPAHVVRLDTGQGTSREYFPLAANASVEVGEELFEQALGQLVLELPLVLRPALQGGLVLASHPSTDSDSRWQRLMRRSFGGICRAGHRRADCLSLLDDVAGLDEWDKLGVALGLSLEPMKQSIAKAVEDTLAPQLFYTVIAAGLISWAALAANPEPVFTKAAAIVSVVMLIYLGVETFLKVLRASRELKLATDRATLPEELEQAGQRFARRVGPEVARIFVLAVTMVASQGMAGGSAWLASRLSMLPRFSEAAAAGANQLGLRLANVGQVSAVAVIDGNLIISLSPPAVAMSNGRYDSGGADASEGGSQSSDYRQTFFAAHPALRGEVVVHHAIEQQVLKRYPGLFTEAELHSLSNLRGIPKSLNPDLHLSQIRRAWNGFYRTHAAPTRQEVLDFAAQLDRQFGAIFEPPL